MNGCFVMLLGWIEKNEPSERPNDLPSSGVLIISCLGHNMTPRSVGWFVWSHDSPAASRIDPAE